MYFKIAMRNLKRNSLRTSLALLGIIIGVMAISSLGILGDGLKYSIIKNFDGVVNVIVLFPNYQEGYYYFTKQDLYKLKRIDGKVIPIYSKFTDMSLKGTNKKSSVRLFGVDKNKIKYIDKNIVLSDTSGSGDTFFKDSFNVEKGDQILIKNISIKLNGFFNNSYILPENTFVVSEKTYKRLNNPKGYSRIYIYVNDTKNIDKVKNEVDNIINRKDKKAIFVVMDSIVKKIEDTISKVSYFVIGIGAISLLVAGIGIGNVMLMSVIERTKEIGVMGSIGASKKDIIILFLYESLLLGIIGSLIGALFSIIIGYLILTFYIKTSFPISGLNYVILGVFFGIITSLISSTYPTYKAAKLNPIKALRNER